MTLDREDLLTQVRRKPKWCKCGYAKMTKDGKGILFKVEGHSFIVSSKDVVLLLKGQIPVVKVSCPREDYAVDAI